MAHIEVQKEEISSLFTVSIKREIRHFHVVVVEKRQSNVQSCCSAY